MRNAKELAGQAKAIRVTDDRTIRCLIDMSGSAACGSAHGVSKSEHLGTIEQALMSGPIERPFDLADADS